MQNKIRWCIFFGGVAVFVAGVELWHRHVQNKDSVYQCRILIDKDFSVDETDSDERTKNERISLYVRTKYGVLPRKQSDPSKIFDAYSATVDCEGGENCFKGGYLKLAVLVKDATKENIQNIIARFPDTKVSFILPHYTVGLGKIAEIIVSSGHEFFIQLPTQSSIPLDKKETVSPFLANASSDEVRDKLYYLMSSAKYAIGIANTSDSLITKSAKDMEVIAKELSQRGMAFLNIEGDGDVTEEISERIKLLSLQAKIFDKSAPLSKEDSIIVDSAQLDDVMQALPEDVKFVPISFGEKDASF
ncbi:MAG: divergent polysaccharide deacetylase family protein [Alphaproteobacteria bacterium]|nr:divergent polysaccharide deacetylase family protein [Alphaproteobacteria bacterium]